MEADRRARFEADKRASFAHLLVKCARLVNARAVERARIDLALPGLRTAHLRLLPHIPYEGIRQADLARELDVSRQAVGQLVGELVDRGALALVPDPADRRAKLVSFSPSGERGLRDGLAVLMEVERELTDVIGEERAATLRDTLAELADALDAG